MQKQFKTTHSKWKPNFISYSLPLLAMQTALGKGHRGSQVPIRLSHLCTGQSAMMPPASIPGTALKDHTARHRHIKGKWETTVFRSLSSSCLHCRSRLLGQSPTGRGTNLHAMPCLGHTAGRYIEEHVWLQYGQPL